MSSDKLPTDEVVDKPSNSTTKASRIIPPTAEVIPRPVNPIVACVIKGVPTLDVSGNPVGMTTALILKPKLPTEEVELTPVRDVNVSGIAVNDPRLDVALNPHTLFYRSYFSILSNFYRSF